MAQRDEDGAKAAINKRGVRGEEGLKGCKSQFKIEEHEVAAAEVKQKVPSNLKRSELGGRGWGPILRFGRSARLFSKRQLRP